jgi:hypothetical protein
VTPATGLARPAAGPLQLGWQYAAPYPEPGPPPRRPVPPEREQLSAAWLAAQRREESLISRPLRIGCAAATAALAVLAGCVLGGWLPALVTAPAIAACLVAAALSGYAIWQGERALRARIRAEQLRVERFRADQESRLFAWQAEHARQVREWQARRLAYESQKRWYAVSLPAGIDRVDVAGGTLSGWSALLTMTAADRLATDGDVTVLDLSGGAVAAELLAVARAGGIQPAVWVLPEDLPRLDLAASLAPADLADVLALSVAVTEERGSTASLAIDTAILERVIGVLGERDGTRLASVTAALRALAQVGDPRADIAAGLLTEHEVGRLSTLFGQVATDRVVLERALSIESQLRKLAATGSQPIPPPRSKLRVIAIDKRVGPLSARLLGGFVVTALTHLLGQAPAGRPWQHTLFLLGAERLRDDVLDRLTDMCENSRSGLVLAYRSMPPPVRQRIGRGNACVAFMRLGNAEDAKAASEQIGTEHRFVLSQLTETVGTSVTDTTGISYTSTVGDSASVATSSSDSDSVSRGGGRSRTAPGGFLPFGGGTSRSAETSTSRGSTQSDSLTAGISTSTAWGVSTTRAAGDSESLAQSLQRSREFLVEAAELQRLPPSAVIVSYATAAGRQVVLADANPAIGGLPDATMTPLAEAAILRAAATPDAGPDAGPGSGPPAGPREPPPNVGPPEARLDWRKRLPTTRWPVTG